MEWRIRHFFGKELIWYFVSQDKGFGWRFKGVAKEVGDFQMGVRLIYMEVHVREIWE